MANKLNSPSVLSQLKTKTNRSVLSQLKKSNRALRSEFIYPSQINWYPGHMERTLKQLKHNFLPFTNIIMEIRDARIPVTSEHPHFDKIIGAKPKLVVFNKADLLSPKHKRSLIDWIDYKNSIQRTGDSGRHEHYMMTTDTRDDTKSANGKQMMKKLQEITDHLHATKQFTPSPVQKMSPSETPASMVGVMGYPNVGKSTVINLLRKLYHKRDSAPVGKLAGVTRHLTYFRISSQLYLLDTPGIFLPGDNDDTDLDALMKLSMCGCIADHIVGHEYIADYILYRLNLHKNYIYLKFCNKKYVNKPCDDIQDVLNAIAHHRHYCPSKKFLRRSFDPEVNRVVETYEDYLTPLYIIDLYRNGKLDHCVLDELKMNINAESRAS